MPDPSLSERARTSESSEMVAERFSGGWEWERKRKGICAFVAAFGSRWEYALEAQFWDSSLGPGEAMRGGDRLGSDVLPNWWSRRGRNSAERP
jgi:hypothetical protein